MIKKDISSVLCRCKILLTLSLSFPSTFSFTPFQFLCQNTLKPFLLQKIFFFLHTLYCASICSVLHKNVTENKIITKTLQVQSAQISVMLISVNIPCKTTVSNHPLCLLEKINIYIYKIHQLEIYVLMFLCSGPYGKCAILRYSD